MPTETKEKAQSHMDEQRLQDADLYELIRQDNEWRKTETKAKAERKPIKDKRAALDAKDMDPDIVYRVGEFTIKKSTSEGGKTVEFVTSAKTSYRIKDTTE